MLYEVRKLAGLIPSINLSEHSGFDSANLYREMALLSPSHIAKFQRGLQWLKNNGIKGVVIGGTAIVHYVSGARDLTPDLDFMVSGLSDIKTKLHAEDIQYSPINGYNRFGGITGIQVPDFDIDFMDSESGNTEVNHMIMKTAILGRIGNAQFLIASPEMLAIHKMEIGDGEKHVDDVMLLLKSGHINSQKFFHLIDVLLKSGGIEEEHAEDLRTYHTMFSQQQQRKLA